MFRRNLIAVVATLSVAGSSFAFGLGDLTKGGNSDKSSSSEPAKSSDALKQDMDRLQKNVNKAYAELNQAQKDLAVSLGMKKEAGEIDKVIASLKSGTTTADDVEKYTEVSGDMNKAIQARLSEKKDLTAKEKKSLSKSFSAYGRAALTTAKVTAEAGILAAAVNKAVKKAGALGGVAMAREFAYVIKSAPVLLNLNKDVISSGLKYVDWGKGNGVSVRDAQKALTDAAGF